MIGSLEFNINTHRSISNTLQPLKTQGQISKNWYVGKYRSYETTCQFAALQGILFWSYLDKPINKDKYINKQDYTSKKLFMHQAMCVSNIMCQEEKNISCVAAINCMRDNVTKEVSL